MLKKNNRTLISILINSSIKSVHVFLALLTISLLPASCLYDATGPSQEELNALRAELILDLQDMPKDKKIAVSYTDAASHNIDFSYGFKTSLVGSAILTIELDKNINTIKALEVWVDIDGNGQTSNSEKKTSSNCLSFPLVFSKENPRRVCYF